MDGKTLLMDTKNRWKCSTFSTRVELVCDVVCYSLEIVKRINDNIPFWRDSSTTIRHDSCDIGPYLFFVQEDVEEYQCVDIFLHRDFKQIYTSNHGLLSWNYMPFTV